MEQSGATSKLLVTFPNKLWLGNLSRTFPYHRFEVKSFIPISQDPFVGNSLIGINGTNPSQILPHLSDEESLIDYFVMEKGTTSITLNVRTKDQFLLKSMVDNFILVDFPIVIEKGIGSFYINASRKQIDQFIESLKTKNIEVELKSIGSYGEDDAILKSTLTNRQYFIYTKAKEEGYYNSPRDITLTELAEKLDVAKSSLSSMLQRIHKKLLG
jgi:hypothetical protein